MTKFDEFVDFQEIIERLMRILNLNILKDLAEELKLEYPNFAQMKRRNTIPYENFLFLCKEKNFSPLMLLEKDETIYKKYEDQLIKNNGKTTNIQLLNSEDEYITVLKIPIQDSYRAYIDSDNLINIVDTANTELSHNQYFLIEKNGFIYKKHVAMELNSNEILLSETNVNDIKINIDELKEYQILGRILYTYLLDDLSNKRIYANQTEISEKLASLLSLDIK